MMISTKGRYALRVMLDLAQQKNENEFMSLKGVAAEQEISVKYLEAIISKLHKSGLVLSHRGKEGGYQLARPADQISVAEIVRSAEGSLTPVACATLEGEPCERAGCCLTLPLWRELDNLIESYLTTVTLEDVLQGQVQPK